MAKAKSFVELGLRKDKFEFFKPKETGNDGGDNKEDENGNGDNVSDYSKKYVFSAIESVDELDKASIRVGLIVRSIKAKSNTLYPIRITKPGC
ncbi:hypothetical protein J1N35_004999 [Gossypium stocksii]|uniref:Uncharacterized protein n=1 Tax=Gossypium stocksii TaxID=47602 RepID=A0A9D3WD01_9ROSI|nr:hypothetical protein J1N35_004999 [Gossypium stocksii]